MSNGAQREMTLQEWVEQLPPIHRARKEFEALQQRSAAPASGEAEPPIKGALALGYVKDPCKVHDAYWTTASGACMVCRAVKAETNLAAVRAENESVKADCERETGRLPT